jgi:hypothetical protein
VTRYYSIDEANAAIPEVERILIALRDQRDELITRRDKVVELSPSDDTTLIGDVREQVRLLRLSMQGLIDQMQAGVARLVDMDVTLRDIATGLIDFPALVSGRPIWLCWRLGESDIEHWHAHDQGFDSRRPLTDLPSGSGRGSGTPAA